MLNKLLSWMHCMHFAISFRVFLISNFSLKRFTNSEGSNLVLPLLINFSFGWDVYLKGMYKCTCSEHCKPKPRLNAISCIQSFRNCIIVLDTRRCSYYVVLRVYISLCFIVCSPKYLHWFGQSWFLSQLKLQTKWKMSFWGIEKLLEQRISVRSCYNRLLLHHW